MKSNNFYLLFEMPGFLTGFFFVLIIVLLLLTIFGIFYLYINAKSKERLALIERGMDPNLARGDFLMQVIIISGGFAAGLIIADMLSTNFGPLLGIIVAAVSLIVYNLFKRKWAQKDFIKKD